MNIIAKLYVSDEKMLPEKNEIAIGTNKGAKNNVFDDKTPYFGLHRLIMNDKNKIKSMVPTKPKSYTALAIKPWNFDICDPRTE